MTVYDRLMEYDEEMLAEFLYRFARDTVRHCMDGIFPDRGRIIELLRKEIIQEGERNE